MPASKPRRLIAAAAAAVLAAGLASCGGGGGTGTTTSTDAALSKAELIAKGDAICKEARDRFAELQGSVPTTPQEAATFTQRLIEITRSEIDQLRALQAPASLQPALKRYLAAMDENVAVMKQVLDAAKRNDLHAYLVARAKTAQDQVKRLQLAQAVGFKECSVPAGTATGNSG